MHLKQLKLAGFKSFVDPTIVHFPSQLVAVLGPNGCGKSNIIDAVRWVMGESSAKNLRGESMTDVIFNGSSNRKPVGQASVELIFDNSLGRLVGPFASYSELAVKRVVTRDGDSSYYLNGSRCRKRDITDAFLGTGAGARGYSIIGQGTISRLIEAKPEELRAFLEEAAGVSKYKERRRETLQRISQTQENLNRVADIRDELDKQLQRLERQAKAAERYTILKEEESLCRAEIMALKWNDFHQQQAIKQKALYDYALSHEEQQRALTQVYSQKTALTEKGHEVNDHEQTVQALFYQVGTEVARLEESIQLHRREQKRLEQDRQLLQADWHKVQEQIKRDEELLQQSQQHSQLLQEQTSVAHKELSEQELMWQQSQQQIMSLNEQWQEAHHKRTTVKSDLQIAQVKLQHSEQNRQQLLIRLEKLNTEKNSFSVAEMECVQEELQEQQETLMMHHMLAEEQLKLGNEQNVQLRSQLHAIENNIHQLHNKFHQQNSEYAALNAIQKAAKQGNKGKAEIEAWSNNSRLIDVLVVDSDWQLACERVLSDDLQAYVLDDFNTLWSQLGACQQGGSSALTVRTPVANPSNRPMLLDKIKSVIPQTVHPLEFIYAAEHIEQAQLWLPDLLSHESIVTRCGTWLGAGWIKCVSAEEQDELGLLSRQQKIIELALIVDELQQTITKAQAERDNQYNQLQQSIKAVEHLQANVKASSEQLSVNSLALEKNKRDLTHSTQLLAAFAIQEEELRNSLEEEQTDLVHWREQKDSYEHLVQEHEQQFVHLNEEKEKQSRHLSALQQGVELIKRRLHQTELEAERELTKTQQLSNSIIKEQERLGVLQERLEQLASLCMQSSTPELEMQERLAEQLLKHSEVELQLTQSREQMNQIKMELDDLEKKIIHYNIVMKQTQEEMAQLRLQEHELSVRASAIEESLSELNLKAELLLEHIPSGTTQSTREDDLIALTEKIKRLGAINLAAIEEFTSEQQRKQYLDEQHADLSEALAILQTAIDKMDKETRMRLETTFDEVNTSFKALFPRLFGGGRAQLELTCDNLLEAGIVVMAQPPGKRNSTIHLLSGGEKAMTAVALVFAIFQLNPSPFCMLDEVDAPLDDVNVGRFCDLVKEMSQFVQFLFITHNKVTMELADHLIGVTMREPGVSRLVAVDVKDALTME